ncbi:lytic polysaccharide monooxygenase auxiliary activity family 9 protein [Streptomyces lonegramiae]|uniref:Lytic polysaccharide monooxygenase n=1 Tax=Streptomyces lonegramiae TaxID=3075524 RepID=A0ABU2XQR3_9ACTN|nr:lytic polysaccharide monooxygenase [Streptomyces sp. DSM 41529]MDT0548270.1 lytic polysaccharide monooxygenase [Streptomyces sp. DSM 41529]
MNNCHDQVRRPLRWALRALGLLSAALLTLIPWTGTASAHGSVIDPASRNYGCWLRWADDFQNPEMAQKDPMCWQAWQDNPNAMWNWNGLYRNGSAGNFPAVVPDGQLCSGGHTESNRYNSLDTVGAWQTTNISNKFTVKLYDQASHGADYFLVYITRQGYDPTTQPLKWSDLQLITKTGKYGPSQNYSIDVSTSGYTGRHVVYTIWQASHMDQTYFLCSDVNFT